MNLFSDDNRIVMTLDAGGTNFVFSAIRSGEEIITPIRKPSNADNLQMCLETIIGGFEEVKSKISGKPEAISFAFPGPADYPNGIIGNLPNLPAFSDDVPLGPILENHFNIPVFINNDGDLFAYGEAIAGALPHINSLLEEKGNPKRYSNLFGITLGTGFGGGIVRNGELWLGDNAVGAEIWLLRNKMLPESNVEATVGIAALKRLYSENSGLEVSEVPSPKDIYEIAKGEKEGNRDAAEKAYKIMGETIGDALANVVTLIDGIIVIGGGMSGAASLLFPHIINEMKSKYKKVNGEEFDRLAVNVYNLEDSSEAETFVKGKIKELNILGSNRTISYDPERKIGLLLSKLGTSEAISLGAYAYALNQLDK